MEKDFIIFLMIGIICVYRFIDIIGKCAVALIVAFKKDLSTKKAKAITKMMSKDINIFKPHNRNS